MIELPPPLELALGECRKLRGERNALRAQLSISQSEHEVSCRERDDAIARADKSGEENRRLRDLVYDLQDIAMKSAAKLKLVRSQRDYELREKGNGLARIRELETALDNIETHALSSLRDGGCDADDVAVPESACEYICELVKGAQP